MKTLEQVFGKLNPEPCQPQFRLPDLAKTLMVSHAKSNRFVGQATYWKRGTRWTCIGCLRTIDWMLDVPFQSIPRSLSQRGLAFKWKWVDALPFVESLQSISPPPRSDGRRSLKQVHAHAEAINR